MSLVASFNYSCISKINSETKTCDTCTLSLQRGKSTSDKCSRRKFQKRPRTLNKDSFLPAVWRRAPSAVWVRGETPPQQELLILVQQCSVIQDVRHLSWGQTLGTLRATELDPALCDFNTEVLAQAAEARTVAAPQQLGELVGGLAHQAQGALQEVGVSGGRGSTQGRLAGGQWLRGGVGGNVLG